MSDTTWVQSPSDPRIRVLLSSATLSLDEALAFVRVPEAGAIITFNGMTRADSNQNHTAFVTALVYEAHKPLALRSLHQAAMETLALLHSCHPNIHRIYVAHRLGEVGVLEDSLVIALSCSHRKEGWEASEYLLERIKATVEIWKQERYSNGETKWRENNPPKAQSEEKTT